jgi:hypothetical protein
VLWRLGLATAGEERDAALVRALYQFLLDSQAPLDQVFFDWRGGGLSADRAARSPIAATYAGEAFAPLRALLLHHPAAPDSNLDHPYFAERTAPCAMLIDEVEAIWAPIAEADDWSRFHAKIAEIALMAEALGSTTLPP